LDEPQSSPETPEARLRTGLHAILPTNRFYATKFHATNFAIEPIQNWPFTTKTELAEDQLTTPPYGRNQTCERSDYSRLHQTSGTTTGKPLRWLDTPSDWQWLLGCWEWIFPKIGITKNDVAFFPFSFGPFLGFWTGFEALTRNGGLCLPGGGMSSTTRLRFALEHYVTVMFATPTYAMHLIEVAAKEGIDIVNSSVRTIVVAGEPGGGIASTRARIEAGWGAKVYDHYGMTEVGPVAVQTCDDDTGLTVNDTAFFTEVIEPGGDNATAAGEIGELVVSNLGRWGSPAIRYRTGDLVRAPEPDHTTTVLRGGILGRVDDMIYVRGNNIFPSSIESIIRRFDRVVEYRLRVERSGSLADLRIEIEPLPGVDGSQISHAVAKAIQDELLFRVEVIAVEPGTLPRHEMKAKRLIVVQN